MAFYNKVGSIMRQSNAHSPSVPSMLKAIRTMSAQKVFVGGLSNNINDQCLRDAFSSFGDVHYAKVIMDRDTGISKGFGFVTFSDSESASTAVSTMDGQPLNGYTLRVSIAADRKT